MKIERNNKGQFLPGNCANPLGARKLTLPKLKLNKMIDNLLNERYKGNQTYLEAIIKMLIKTALSNQKIVALRASKILLSFIVDNNQAFIRFAGQRFAIKELKELNLLDVIACLKGDEKLLKEASYGSNHENRRDAGRCINQERGDGQVLSAQKGA